MSASEVDANRYENDPRFDKTVYYVEATGYERQALWELFHDKCKWEQDSLGWYFEVGRLKRMPIVVAFWWARIESQYVMFYEATSQVVDYRVVEEWLKKRMPGIGHTDAWNFHHAVQAVKEFNSTQPKEPSPCPLT